MPIPANIPFMAAAQLGLIDGVTVVNKFGRHNDTGTTPQPVCPGGIYQVPTEAKSLEIVSAAATDSASGVGIQEMRIEGIADDGTLQKKDVELDGTTAVVIPGTWRRVFRIKGIRAGRYAALGALSQDGDITLREEGGGATWTVVQMLQTGIGAGQSQIGAYTVPKGFTALLMKKKVTIESTKLATVYVFARENILDTVAPFSAATLKEMEEGVVDHMEYGDGITPIAKFKEMTDFAIHAKVNQTTGSVSCDMQIVLFDNEKFDL